MTSRALLPKLVLLAALIGGTSYVWSWSLGLPDLASTVWKGSGVGLLAVYAALKARNPMGWALAAVMTLGALGDVLLEAAGLIIGAIAFLAGHLVAIWLYARNLRPGLGGLARIAALAVVPLTVGTAYGLSAGQGAGLGIPFYALGLSTMAAFALMSRFSPPWVGLGALMFVVSDLLIFSRSGVLAGQAWLGLAIWGLYFGGQVLICLGVARVLEPQTEA
jgi:hypothetical protein